MSLFELLFNNTQLSFSYASGFARYDEEGYPLDEDYLDEDLEDEDDYLDEDEPWDDDSGLE